MALWPTLKAGLHNAAANAFTDKDGDFCPGTTLGIATGVAMLVVFLYHGSVDFMGLATAEATIITAIAAKRWSENK